MIKKIKKSGHKKNLHREVRIEITEEEIIKRIDQIELLDIEDEFREFLISALEALVALDKIIGMKETTLHRLRQMFNKKSEKLPSAFPVLNDKNPSDKPSRGNNKGKNGKEKYPLASTVKHNHTNLISGQVCPECQAGKIYDYSPGVYIRITGSAPLKATVHETQKLRCNTCGKIFEADFEGKNGPKYDEGAHAIVALLKYGASVPFYRLEKIQKHLYTPMPASTQWELMEVLAKHLYPIWLSLLKFAADGHKFYIDDTGGKVLSLIQENKNLSKKDRRGIFTTGIVVDGDFGRIVLYLTGRNHAGENLDRIIKMRENPSRPILMSDALSSNDISDFEFIRCYCLTHARRNFKTIDEDELENECQFILDNIAIVYKNDKDCKEKNLSDKERLSYHQAHSTKAMDDIKSWCIQMMGNNELPPQIEPNAPLYTEINYLLNHWEGLTAFLRIEGAPLDNNLTEEKLRLQVLNRKNFLFYKTELGALIGDIICSILKTCEAVGVNPFEYLVWVQKNTKEAKLNPENFLPWKFKEQNVKS